MRSSTDVYIFGDQSIPVLDGLQELLMVKDDAPLTAFLNNSISAIQQEISALPSTEKEAIPRGDTLALLLNAVRRGAGHTAIESAFLCIYEIGYYIELLAQSRRQHPPTDSSFFVGICTGSLAAAAISCSTNVFDITRLGVQAVVAAFRNGMHIRRRAALLGDTTAGYWSVVLPATQEGEAAKIISDFCIKKGLPQSVEPYISALGPNFVTISGPPTVLDELKAFAAQAGKKAYPVPIRGPYHNRTAYSGSDVVKLLDASLEGLEFLDRAVQTPVMSCATGFILKEKTYGTLMREALESVLIQQIRIDRVTNSLAETLLKKETVTSLIPVNTQLAATLGESLARRGAQIRVHKPIFNAAATEPTDATSSNKKPGDAEKIAIVGFSGRFPDADDLTEFWDLLQQGLDVHRLIPEERFDRSHYDPTGKRKNTSQIQHGCWLKNAGHFDTQFFHMSPKEAVQTDPAQRLALLTAYEALEMAGFVPDRTASTKRQRVGVFYGTTSNDWGEVNSSQDIDTYYIPGANRAFIPGRINYFFKFTGPSIAVDTACSSSLAAINIAMTSLLKRDCDTAIAGGTNVMTNPDNFAGLDRGHFLSRTGNCKTFDDEADGYCRADGIGTVILKRLPDALADKDPIFGVILGAHTNHNAESVSITRPLADAQEFLFKKIISETGIKPHDVSYIEMHGTGTQAGDAVEMRSVLDTFAWDYSRPANKTLHLGSVKANIGHAESASGVLALIKVLLMMQKNKIPPHCGIKTKINHGFPTDLEKRGVRIALGNEADWPRPQNGKRRVFVNNFSAAGGNTSLLLEDGPAPSEDKQVQPADSRSHHVVAVSARSTKALEENLRAFAQWIDIEGAKEENLLARLSYTTTARRIHHNRRVAFVANDVNQLKQAIIDAANTCSDIKAVPAKTPGIGFLFTGQGAQETAMARALYQNFSSFRSDIHELDSIAKFQGLGSVMDLVNGQIAIEQLSPIVVQLGTCVIQIALARFWSNLGIHPQYVVGHSLGEYAALHIAGILSINDTIFLCGRRAMLLRKRCNPGTHGMVAVRESHQVLRAHLPPSLGVEVACINGPQDTVLSGPNAVIDGVCSQLKQLGFKFTKLDLPFAFHSSQVDPILDELEELSLHVKFNAPTVPFVSTLLGKVVTEADVVGPQYLRRHCRESVDFHGAVQGAEKDGIINKTGLCIEIGANPLLSRMVKSTLGSEMRCLASLRRGENCFKTLSESLSALHVAGIPVNWNEFHRDFVASHKVVRLPSYSWQLANYWMTYQYSWCLTKGDAPEEPVPAIQQYPIRSTRLSDAVHVVLQESIEENHSFIEIESDMHDPGLLRASQDHKVNGLTMCPSTLYADLAYTLSKHLLGYKEPGIQHYMPDICNMAAEKALIVNEKGPQVFRAAMDMDWTLMRGTLEVYSVDANGKRTSVHATCNVELQDPAVFLGRWNSHEYLINRSIEHLVDGVDSSSIHKLHRGVAYKMFSSTVQYGPAYQGMREVWFDSEKLEATAKVNVPVHNQQYGLSAFACDSLGHLTGFIMNCNDTLELSDHIYVNHGWTYLHLSEPYQCGVDYQTHVKMRRLGDDDSTFSGDVHVLRDGKIIAICGGVTFKRVSKKVLEMLLPSPGSSKAKSNKAKAVAATAPAAVTPVSRALPAPVTIKKASPSAAPAKTAAPAPVKVSSPSPPPAAAAPASSGLLAKALQIISDEIGVDQSELTDSTLFADLGVDSLMSLTILGEFREELDLDIPAAQFYECLTVKDFRDFMQTLAPEESEASSDAFASDTESLEIVTPPSTISSPPPSVIYDVPKCTSTILQGTKRCSKTLFLFPDGAGSATSYVTLPQISADLRVYGLNSPYLTKPQDFQCPLGGITDSYLNEIRRRQPTGPYNLAGWSAGGVSAYDAAQKLVAQGEVVESLIFIDSPNPVGLGKLPARMYDFLEQSGIFGAFEGSDAEMNAPPDWLFQHFLVFIEALDRYQPIPFQPGTTPPTTIVWAADGVCKYPTDARPEPRADDPRGMKWLLDNRDDFGPNGWDDFLEKRAITTHSMENANHFTMMREPTASPLVEIIRSALGI